MPIAIPDRRHGTWTKHKLVARTNNYCLVFLLPILQKCNCIWYSWGVTGFSIFHFCLMNCQFYCLFTCDWQSIILIVYANGNTNRNYAVQQRQQQPLNAIERENERKSTSTNMTFDRLAAINRIEIFFSLCLLMRVATAGACISMCDVCLCFSKANCLRENIKVWNFSDWCTTCRRRIRRRRRSRNERKKNELRNIRWTVYGDAGSLDFIEISLEKHAKLPNRHTNDRHWRHRFINISHRNSRRRCCCCCLHIVAHVTHIQGNQSLRYLMSNLVYFSALRSLLKCSLSKRPCIGLNDASQALACHVFEFIFLFYFSFFVSRFFAEKPFQFYEAPYAIINITILQL